MENLQRRGIPVTKVVVDVLLLMCVGFPILFLFLWCEPYHRGFFCDDVSLRHPYHASTVPSYYLYIIGLGMNCAVMIATEIINSVPHKPPMVFKGYSVPSWMWESYCVIGVFAFGAACSQLTTDVLKYTIGRLRPHFFTVCRPDCTIDQYEFITNYTCTNPDYINNARIMKEMRLSFPSGHSSFSMYAALYFAIYVQVRMVWNGSKLLKHTLQFLAITAALFTAMTRISDYKHHWSDVLTGLAIGSTTACIVTRYVSGLIQPGSKSTVEKSASTEINNLNGNSSQLV